MRITFNCSTTETLEYLRLVNTILRNNKSVDDEVQAYKALKELTLSLTKRVDELEAEAKANRRHVCR